MLEAWNDLILWLLENGMDKAADRRDSNDVLIGDKNFVIEYDK